MKKFKITAVLIVMTMILTACSEKSKSESMDNSDTINVVTSFYGMKALAEEIGGDKVNIDNIIPEGSEPHDFDIKAKDMKAIEESDIFIYNGAGMEEWVTDVEAAIGNNKLITVEASKGVELINADGTDNNNLGKDPHTWLGLTSAKVEAENIKNALQEKDTQNKDYYEKNYEEFAGKIDEIISEYVPKFQDLQDKEFITGHATFGYLCRDLGLTQSSIEGVFAEGEPSPKELEKLILHCKNYNIKVIFVEELISQNLSNTLAKEVGATTKQIYTLHSSEDKKSFSDTLRYNVETIYSAMKQGE
ncbi:MAG: zinc ABC transporter substrate-binding protein [Clostridium sp.]|uniref:metal ABC transporter solute-binding protein, Zn/Mn family n=1 Tax=Clostridium sp. TaxID=1506 RepID=UPI00302CD75F